MTIHEMEEKTGMTRANIRYYERAGLLSPERSGNNYRDYSEADLAALQKVRLLRQLRIPISEIARLQAGEADLCSVLQVQTEKLQAESKETSEAADLCRELWEAQVSYSNLDAEHWLHRAAVSDDRPRRWQPAVLDVLPTAPWLWKRCLARLLDFTLVSTLLAVLRMLVLRQPFSSEWWIIKRYYGFIGMPDHIIAWENALTAFAVLAVVEALLLCTLGTTPGKWAFGLRVFTSEGRKLTFWLALKRFWGIFVKGLGCTIPFYSLWRLWKSYRTAEKGGALPWEAESVCEAEARRLCGLWFVLANALCVSAVLLAFAQAVLPLHTGELTVRELTENCSMFERQYRGGYSCYLTEEGVWVDRRNPESRSVMSNGIDPDPVYQFETDERGIVTAVHIDYERVETNNSSFWVPDDREILYFAYVLANNQVTPWELLQQNSFHLLSRHLPSEIENYTVEEGRVRMTNRFSYSGYQMLEGYEPYVEDQPVPIPGEEQRTYWSVSFELIPGGEDKGPEESK